MEKYCATADVKCTGGANLSSQSAGLTSSALPEVQKPIKPTNLQTGISANNDRSIIDTCSNKKDFDMPRWYALCTTYCREKTAYDHLVSKNIEDFYTTMKSIYDDMTASAGEAGKINSGRKIRITEGKFMTVLGTVACDQSQSRVGIMVDGPPTVGTALVPRAFI